MDRVRLSKNMKGCFSALSNQKRHLILIGMMGTGKSTIGQMLAEQLQLPLLDTDQLFEAKNNMSIAAFFSEWGESTFRQKESQLLQETVQNVSSVITTGGGIVLENENCALMKSHGWVIHLSARPDVLVRRLQDDQTRPLLQGNIEQRIGQLILERKEKYQFADKHIDTSDRMLTDIVAEIIRHWSRKSV